MFTTEKFKPNSLCTSLHAIIIQGLSLNNFTALTSWHPLMKRAYEKKKHTILWFCGKSVSVCAL